MIHLSPAAVNEVKRLKFKQQPNVMFRLAVKPGGCSGWYYDISFDEIVVPSDDCIFQCDGISVVIDIKSLNYINDLTLDYSEDLMGGGFRFHNNNAIATCGCGNSFSIYAQSAI
ncbi:MAG: iron-sulfur cluster assembly accessory protein [Cyanomargarita calcarea GSE-NOS-MK-12-04C]|jgi:iron-sulfur cluster assembly accessory protein|uniref:Iron-sulfur cluster assembly accessory protein n=1 Tax=Cyanomargarita calcarea GSE-NOS-MK-12-04C TaxID=2839659 RepID=A0A951UR17_9CYAN|nr:iron-sulfur cluster assembly accessory protein [Cyanomargarita calcarea GSE-NOS-MK-12-04C]